MTIERQGRTNTIVCDSCEDDYGEYPAEEFTAMIAAARSDGWEIRPDGEAHYTHKCPGCAGSNLSRVERATRMFK